MSTIYQDAKAAGIPIANHYSDLYLKNCEETRQLLKKHGQRARTFVNQVEGGIWVDVPFAFDPYWEAKQAK
jgi:hypothetical protein